MYMDGEIQFRRAVTTDHSALWALLRPILTEGETFALPRDMSEDAAITHWCGGDHDTYVALIDGLIVGTFYIRHNQLGGGAHIANAGYATSVTSRGRGIARKMCGYSMELARQQGYRGMQFNFVVSTNHPAVGLWESCGFRILTRLPGAFLHPKLGFVDALVMFREL
jgi:ribosomal protein S18 acetylase RimI-like enzyme